MSSPVASGPSGRGQYSTIPDSAFDGEIIYRHFHDESGTKFNKAEGFTAGGCLQLRKELGDQALHLDESIVDAWAAQHVSGTKGVGTPLISFSIREEQTFDKAREKAWTSTGVRVARTTVGKLRKLGYQVVSADRFGGQWWEIWVVGWAASTCFDVWEVSISGAKYQTQRACLGMNTVRHEHEGQAWRDNWFVAPKTVRRLSPGDPKLLLLGQPGVPTRSIPPEAPLFKFICRRRVLPNRPRTREVEALAKQEVGQSNGQGPELQDITSIPPQRTLSPAQQAGLLGDSNSLRAHALVPARTSQSAAKNVGAVDTSPSEAITGQLSSLKLEGAR